MLQGKKAVLFDLDGTLADSMWVWTDIDRKYGEKYGICFPDTFHQDIEGKSFYETAVYFRDRFALAKTAEEIMEEWNEMALEAYRTRVPLKDGAREFLLYLREHHFQTAICTSNSRMLVDALCQAVPVLGHIDCILTSGDVKAGKPAPDIYLKSARLLGVKPEECLVFEDIPQGIQAGRNAGMEVCAVEDDFSRDLASQKKKLAQYYIKSFRQIANQTYEILK